MYNYNLFGKLNEFISDFDRNKVLIAGNKTGEEARYLTAKNTGYLFSQRDMLTTIDFAMNSVFRDGKTDTEGQRKIYMNRVRFIRDVTRMRTDVDVKNYVFHPDTFEDIWPVYFASRRFKIWTREEGYGEELNRLGDDFCTYGTVVTKKVGKEVKRVPLRSLRNTQDAESLKKAVKNGGYVIEEHDWTLSEMEEMKGYDVSGLKDYSKKYKCYELYTLIPRNVINKHNGGRSTVRDDKMVPAQCVLIPTESNKTDEGKVLFIEEIDEAPYEEAHYEKMDGRWLGRGPVESQLENQIATNLVFNLQRRALLHSSKRVYQTANEEVAKNLIKDVKDGEVLYVGVNGQITSVANEARNMGEIQVMNAVLDKNSQQMSFTFEAATGESMPSGTPFRLGVILSQAVESHFQLKKEVFAQFLKRSFFNQIIPIFQRDSKEHTLQFAGSEEGIETLKKAMIDFNVSREITDQILKGELPDPAIIRQAVTDKLSASPYLFVEVPEGFYKDLIFHMELDITDEATDSSDIESLTTLYTSMAQIGDPRAEKVLQMIFASKGKNLEAITGPKPQQQPQQIQQATQQLGQQSNPLNTNAITA